MNEIELLKAILFETKTISIFLCIILGIVSGILTAQFLRK